MGIPDLSVSHLPSQDLSAINDANASYADLFTPDSFTPDSFTPDLFAPDSFTPDLFTPDLSTPDLFTPDMACAGGLMNCSGACIDLTTDSANCGACGHDCHGTTCAASICPPTVLASGQNEPWGITVDANNVYWGNSAIDSLTANQGSVMKLSLTSPATPVTLASALNCPIGIAVDATYVYWANWDYGATIQKTPIASGAVTTVATGQTLPWSVKVDATNLYWGNQSAFCNNVGDGAIIKMALPSGTPTALWSGHVGCVGGIAIDSSYVYFANFDELNGSEIEKVPIGGGAAVILASNVTSPFGVAVDANNVYWNTDALIQALPIGTATTASLATAQSTIKDIAIDATHVYFLNGGDGTIKRVPIASGPVVTLATAQTSPTGIAVDQTYVYWTRYGAGTITRVAK